MENDEKHTTRANMAEIINLSTLRNLVLNTRVTVQEMDNTVLFYFRIYTLFIPEFHGQINNIIRKHIRALTHTERKPFIYIRALARCFPSTARLSWGSVFCFASITVVVSSCIRGTVNNGAKSCCKYMAKLTVCGSSR